MKMANRTSLRRNYSAQSDIKPNKQLLPQLVRCENITSSPTLRKKYHFDPFKLRANQDKPVEKQNKYVLTSSVSEELQINPKNVLIIHHPRIIETIAQSTIMGECALKQGKKRLQKRRTLGMGSGYARADSSKQNLCQDNDLSPQVGQNIEKYKKRSSHRPLTRKYSFEVMVSQTSGQDDKKSIFYDKQIKMQKVKLLCYHEFIKKQTQLHDIQLQKMESYEDQKIFFSIDQGNNRQLVLEAMKKRWWWSYAKQESQKVNFLWTQLKDRNYGIQQAPMQQRKGEEQLGQPIPAPQITSFTLHNHFQENKYLGSKLSLYLTMKAYCSRKEMKLCDILLPTFFVTRIMDEQWKSFTKSYFDSLQISNIDNWDVGTNKRYWIIKQFSQKSAKDKIYSTYKEIKLHIEKLSKSGSRFLIQRYISKPFLYKKRKFDIRCYALIVRLKQKTHVYLHREGVISTACEPFDIRTLDNQFSNFTTESVQVQNDKFGEYEPGNKIDFRQFQSHLDIVYGDKYSFMEAAFPVMQESISAFARASQRLVNTTKRGPCFELVQCEFVMDEDFKPWLIDVHTNPCLETYCPALEKVIPQIIQDTLRHTLDVLFPPPLQWPQSKHHLLPSKAKETGFALILDGLKQEESDGEGGLEMSALIDSDSNIYEDNVIDDTEYIESCSNLNDFEYLMNQSMLRAQ